MPIFASNFASNSLTGTATVVAGNVTINLTPAAIALEGDRTFVVKLRKGSSQSAVIATSPVVTIKDRTTFVSLTANTATVNEGNLVAFTLVTTNVVNGAIVYYSVLPATANVTSDDFVSNTGSVVITNNAATFALQANINIAPVDETGETFNVQLRTNSPTGNIVYVTSNVTILDTYKTYNVLTFAPTAVTSLENSNVTFTFSATNVPLGTVLYYETAGNATVTANTGSFVLNSLSNTFTVSAGAVSTGATRAFTVNLRAGSAVAPIVATSNTAYVIDSALAYMTATGGNEVYTINGYKVHKFLSSNNFTITTAGASPAYSSIEVLMVAGGGAGAYANKDGTGAGAGGLLYYGANTTPKTPNGSAILVNTNDTYVVTVGAGGSSAGANGSNTTIAYNSNTFLIALGGGYGSTTYGGGGGSGGGGGYGYPAGSNGTPGQGYPGGNTTGPFPSGAFRGGGGGGAGGAGGNGAAGGVDGLGGAGGAGLYYSISGTDTAYAGGGGGSGSPYGVGGAGGSGVGGGGNYYGGGGAGLTNTGGGGGAGNPGGSGGPGIVIIRYPFVESPTYTSLTTTSSVTYEGLSPTFTLNTLNLANNTLLYYTTVGNVISSDFVSGNTGSFRTTANTSTITLALNSNIPTNEERYFQLQIRTDSLTDPVVFTSNVITIKDSNLKPNATSFQYLMVAGGGGGTTVLTGGGGGGGGGVVLGNANVTVGYTYVVAIGAGGSASVGGNTSILINSSNIGAYGGGVGGGATGAGPLYPGAPGGTGGSGGGASSTGSSPSPSYGGGSGISGQGYAGGSSTKQVPGQQGAGGGGAGGVGQNAADTNTYAGAGGIGIYSSLSGTRTGYAGGGGGTCNGGSIAGAYGAGGAYGLSAPEWASLTAPAFGAGGAGPGSSYFTSSYNQTCPGGSAIANGTTNTGGGGLGGSGIGGSGVVVIATPDGVKTATSTTGSPNVIYANNNIIYRFWQSGTITF